MALANILNKLNEYLTDWCGIQNAWRRCKGAQKFCLKNWKNESSWKTSNVLE
jgi:hypothetical protein